MKKLMMRSFLTIGLTMFVLAACANNSNSSDTPQTVEQTAEIFVQALIDGNEETLSKLNYDQTYPTAYVLNDIAPQFSGLKLSDLTFELEESDKVSVEYDQGEVRYSFRIEKIGEDFVVTKII